LLLNLSHQVAALTYIFLSILLFLAPPHHFLALTYIFLSILLLLAPPHHFLALPWLCWSSLEWLSCLSLFWLYCSLMLWLYSLLVQLVDVVVVLHFVTMIVFLDPLTIVVCQCSSSQLGHWRVFHKSLKTIPSSFLLPTPPTSHPSSFLEPPSFPLIFSLLCWSTLSTWP
jgi:hypothetical protein